MFGYVYVLINTSIPNLLKIGMTRREVDLRVKELSSATGVAAPFICIFKEEFDNCEQAEIDIHRSLSKYRENANREFFRIEPEVAIKEIIRYKNELSILKKDDINVSNNKIDNEQKVNDKQIEFKEKALKVAKNKNVPIEKRIKKYEEAILNMVSFPEYIYAEDIEVCGEYLKMAIDNKIEIPSNIKERVKGLFDEEELLTYLKGLYLEKLEFYKLKSVILGIYNDKFSTEDKKQLKAIAVDIMRKREFEEFYDLYCKKKKIIKEMEKNNEIDSVYWNDCWKRRLSETEVVEAQRKVVENYEKLIGLIYKVVVLWRRDGINDEFAYEFERRVGESYSTDSLDDSYCNQYLEWLFKLNIKIKKHIKEKIHFICKECYLCDFISITSLDDEDELEEFKEYVYKITGCINE